MMLAQEVLRLLTIKALRGRTWVGDRVFDSPAQPADLKLQEDRAAFVAVYTDDADMMLDGDSLMAGENTVFLTIEIAVADTTTVGPAAPATDQDPTDADIDRVPGGEAAVTMAQTDEALELSIGMIAHQVQQALTAPDNPWAELWRLLTSMGREKVEVRRGGPGQEDRDNPPAVRYASKILRMQLRVLGEPAFREGVGADPTTFWHRFLAAADADAELAPIALLLRSHFEGEPGLPGWRAEQAQHTMTQEALVALRITPLIQVIPDEAEPDPLTQVTGEDEAGGPAQVYTPGEETP